MSCSPPGSTRMRRLSARIPPSRAWRRCPLGQRGQLAAGSTGSACRRRTQTAAPGGSSPSIGSLASSSSPGGSGSGSPSTLTAQTVSPRVEDERARRRSRATRRRRRAAARARAGRAPAPSRAARRLRRDRPARPGRGLRQPRIRQRAPRVPRHRHPAAVAALARAVRPRKIGSWRASSGEIDLLEPELLALVEERRAGQREQEERRGAAPRALPKRVTIRVTSWFSSTHGDDRQRGERLVDRRAASPPPPTAGRRARS